MLREEPAWGGHPQPANPTRPPLTALPGHCWREISSEHQRWTLTLHALHRKPCLEFPGDSLGSTRRIRQRRMHPGARSKGGRLGHWTEEGVGHPHVSLGAYAHPSYTCGSTEARVPSKHSDTGHPPTPPRLLIRPPRVRGTVRMEGPEEQEPNIGHPSHPHPDPSP